MKLSARMQHLCVVLVAASVTTVGFMVTFWHSNPVVVIARAGSTVSSAPYHLNIYVKSNSHATITVAWKATAASIASGIFGNDENGTVYFNPLIGGPFNLDSPSSGFLSIRLTFYGNNTFMLNYSGYVVEFGMPINATVHGSPWAPYSGLGELMNYYMPDSYLTNGILLFFNIASSGTGTITQNLQIRYG